MITREELEKVKYKDFKTKFTELGIPEVFEEHKGKKGIILIEKALEKLEAIAKVKAELPKDVTEDEVKKKAELHIETKEERQKKLEKEKETRRQVSEKRKRDHYADLLSRTDTATLKRAFSQTKANLNNAPQPILKKELQQKLTAIDNELSKRD